ncbi:MULTISPECIES: twin-arginine translocase TatA/TatE family subunit [Aeromicrobium]|uniref:twin-arginine translocase TatA/TatE family subunit n=1 Tax=Aeromicrobium TaxID=2040 RepID=UPI0006FE96D2|nr:MULTISPECIES: twin-arginine translocase TatA/TatE family subunit [Aeromicrobium]KQX75077.1 Sec-independent secretion protein [Aeromicrobium sp. Root472D3]MBD8605519.1 twin-arginine translocase TatA/TatE family subunit [Aeromicrobium sp. CFBP 8757]MCL8250434.1 twin-arginine translocase TatA/TatE family subunit [Aeromicrobium fastidiosum]
MLQNLTGWHALVILAIVLLVFGSSKLPQLAKGVGQSMRILKDEVHDASSTDAAVDPVTGQRAA